MPSSKTALTVVLFAGLVTVAAASEIPRLTRPPVVAKPSPAPAPTSFPHKALAAAAARWKIKDAATRIRKPGAAGRHDLFWEVMTLLEKNEKARADAELVAVMDWLLFTAELWKHRDLGPAASRKIPKLVPALGARLLEARLKEWIARAAVRYPGGDPWTWPEFSGEGRKLLGRTARRLLATGPRHNPMTRVWIAAALVVAGEKDAGKELAEARKLLAERLPSKVNLVTNNLGYSLASGGSKECLALLLDAAESHKPVYHRRPIGLPGRGKELLRKSGLPDGAEEVSAKRPGPSYYRGGYWPPPLTRFYCLVGWIQPADKSKPKEAIAEARKWLGTNVTKLSWDTKSKRFSGGTAQPGLEEFHRAAAAFKKKSGHDVVAGLSAGTQNSYGALLQLLAFGEKDAAAARTAEFKEVARGLIRLAGNTLSGYHTTLMPKLSAIAPELAAEVYVSVVRAALIQAGSSGYYRLSSLSRTKPEVLAAACAKLQPEFKKRYAAAAKASDAAAKMHAGVAYLYVGGKLAQGEIYRLVDGGLKVSSSYKHQLTQAGDYMARSGRTAGLRVTLAVARVEVSGGGKHSRYSSALHRFHRLVGWELRSFKLTGVSSQMIRKAEKWLEKHEKSLKWDAAKGQFIGALAPELEKQDRLCAAIEKKWGLKLREDLGDQRAGHERAAKAIVDLVRKKPAAAQDKNVIEMVDELAKNVISVRFGAGRLLTDLHKVNRKLGVRAWTAWIRRRLKPDVGGRSSITYLAYADRMMRGMDFGVLRDACKPLVAELQADYAKSVTDKEDPQDQLVKAWACAYAGGKVDEAEIRKLMKIDSARRGFHAETTWGSALACAGRKLGLRVLLWHAEFKPSASGAMSLSRFDYLSGRSNEKYTRYHRESAEKIRAWVKQRLAWMKANEAKLVWNSKTGRFKVNGKAIRPPDPGDPEVF